MNCPTCKTEFRIVERHGVEVDYCRSCRGIWLEEGSLERILDTARSEPHKVRIPSLSSQNNTTSHNNNSHNNNSHNRAWSTTAVSCTGGQIHDDQLQCVG